MKQKHLWRPGKYVVTADGIRASADPRKLGRGSRLITEIVARAYASALREHARGVLLDLGCGDVPLYDVYRDRVTDNICIDRGGTADRELHLDYAVDLDRGLPLADASVDTVLATDLLEHIADPAALWREMARVLTPGGKLIVGVPFLYWIHEEPRDFYRYTEHQLRRACAEHQLRVISLDPYGGAVEVLLDILAKHLAFSRLLSAAHLTASRALINSRLGRAVSRRGDRKFPLGYCLVAEKSAL